MVEHKAHHDVTAQTAQLSSQQQDHLEHSQVEKRIDQFLTLTDGRRLGYSEYGAPDGKPIFLFHGFPGSRISWPAFDPDELCTKLHARIIAIDRPGYGISDDKRSRALLDWPEDVLQVASALSLDQFAVLGVSGGGPYALACAFKIPERLTAVATVCGMGPGAAPGSKEGASWLYPRMPAIVRWPVLMLMAMLVRKKSEMFVSMMNDAVSKPDQELLQAHPELATAIVEDWQEAFRSGIGGVHQESALYSRPWGFMLEDITTKVHLWHGEKDNNVSISVGRYVAQGIPDCHASFSENEGHFSIIYNQLEDILKVLVA